MRIRRECNDKVLDRPGGLSYSGTGLLACLLLLTTTACRQDMHDQPRYKPLGRSAFFEDGRSSRPLLAGTVARGHLNDDEQLYTGKSGDEPVATFPFPITERDLRRGQDRKSVV